MLWYLDSHLQLCLRLPLLAELPGRVTLLLSLVVEEVPVIRREWDAVLNPEHQIWVRDEVSPKGDQDVLVFVFLIHCLVSCLRDEATSNDDRARLSPDIDQEVDTLGYRTFDVGVCADSRFNDVEVCQFQLLQFFRIVAELGHGVLHLHSLEVGEWTHADAHLIGTDRLDDGLGNLQTESRSLLDAASPGIGPLVANILQELVDQVAIGAVDLNSIEASLDGVLRRLLVVSNELPDLLLGHGSRRSTALEGDIARAQDPRLVPQLLLQDSGVRRSAQTPQLTEDKRALGMDVVGDLLPLSNLRRAVDARGMGVAAGLRRDEGAFADQQSAGRGTALRVVVGDEREGNVRGIGAEAGQRSEDNAVLDLETADAQGLEELAFAGHVGWWC